jgi:hypothetical protein
VSSLSQILEGWHRAAAVLFDAASLRGDSAPRREAGQGAPTLPCRSSAGGGLGTDFDCDGGLVAQTIESGIGRRRHDEQATYVSEVVGTLSDGAHMGGGGLNGQDAYSGRIFAVRGAVPERRRDGADPMPRARR